MTARLLGISLLVLALTATAARADNNVAVTSAGPGCTTGTVNIQGTITVATGWLPSGNVTLTLWKDGCQVSTVSVSPTLTGCGTYSFTYMGSAMGALSSGTTYNVIGDLTFAGMCFGTSTLRTQPATATAK